MKLPYAEVTHAAQRTTSRKDGGKEEWLPALRETTKKMRLPADALRRCAETL
jgi:hypothetical protein